MTREVFGRLAILSRSVSPAPQTAASMPGAENPFFKRLSVYVHPWPRFLADKNDRSNQRICQKTNGRKVFGHAPPLGY